MLLLSISVVSICSRFFRSSSDGLPVEIFPRLTEPGTRHSLRCRKSVFCLHLPRRKAIFKRHIEYTRKTGGSPLATRRKMLRKYVQTTSFTYSLLFPFGGTPLAIPDPSWLSAGRNSYLLRSTIRYRPLHTAGPAAVHTGRSPYRQTYGATSC